MLTKATGMTRINVVHPEILSQKHLQGEWHEIPRMYGYVDKAIRRGERPESSKNPSEYTLGTGHVRFFYPRMGFVFLRHIRLHQEMTRRGYKPSYDPMIRHYAQAEKYHKLGWFGAYAPTMDAIRINMERLRERGGYYPDEVEFQHLRPKI